MNHFDLTFVFLHLKDEKGLINAIFKFYKILGDEKCMSYIKHLKKVNYLIKKKIIIFQIIINLWEKVIFYIYVQSNWINL
ncbi:hypothetical protein BpHYR1_024187 [Brachionus plicatilis]|uniref:Uncharacterized protein n=1 Tax=Brachionus plicatilis TaxID=10195 RepID=A0A3M7SLE9_BRAPC|nr:hypothetical protein BpHYR1_024187 [Brachionus plicatilis]